MKETMSVHFTLVPRAQIAGMQKRDMFELLMRHFEGVTPEQFARDLAEKNLALLLWRGESLVGFSTMLSYTTAFEDETVNVIYSGDTIVAPEAWEHRPCRVHGSPALMPCAWRCRRGRVSGCCLRRAFEPIVFCRYFGASSSRASIHLRPAQASAFLTASPTNALVHNTIRSTGRSVLPTRKRCALG